MIRRADSIKDADLGKRVVLAGTLVSTLPMPLRKGVKVEVEVACDAEVEVITKERR